MRCANCLKIIAFCLLTFCAGFSLSGADIDIVPVAQGDFPMGDLWNTGQPVYQPVHNVSVAPGFYMSRYEITNAQFVAALNWALDNWQSLPMNERIKGANVSPYMYGTVYVNGKKVVAVGTVTGDYSPTQITYSTLSKFGVKTRNGKSMATHPVVTVTWYGAITYCNWQSRMEGLTPAYDLADPGLDYNRSSASGYRLPSEAEWEMAAGFDPSLDTNPSSATSPISSHWPYGFKGDILDSRAANYGSANPLNLVPDPQTVPVDFYNGVNLTKDGLLTRDARSYYGCYGMSGNAAEWCQDAFHDSYIGAPTDGTPWSDPAASYKVVRGGSWASLSGELASYSRAAAPPNSPGGNGEIGFRVARTSLAPSAAPFMESVFPSIISRNGVLSGNFILVKGMNFSPSNTENVINLQRIGMSSTAPVFGSTASGMETRFKIPVAFLPASPDEYPVTVTVSITSKGVVSSNTQTITIVEIPTGTNLIPSVSIPPSGFEMGDVMGEGDPDELPSHGVNFYKGFDIGKYEVTNGEYAAALNWAMLNNGTLPVEERVGKIDGTQYTGGQVYVNGRLAIDVGDADKLCLIDYTNGVFVPSLRDTKSMENAPVVMVTWYGALAFCNWQSRMEERDPAYDLSKPDDLTSLDMNQSSTFGYRLPSEAEWEAAAASDPYRPSGSMKWRYATMSDGISFKSANYYDSGLMLYNNPLNLTEFPFVTTRAFFDGANKIGTEATMDAHSYYGCYDMSGNVYEWCQDWYHPSYAGAPADGSPWQSPSGIFRILRGGSWNASDFQCRASFRAGSGPGIRSGNIGFRVARFTDKPPVVWHPASAQGWELFE